MLSPHPANQPRQFFKPVEGCAPFSEPTTSCRKLMSRKPYPHVPVLSAPVPVRLPAPKHRSNRNQAVSAFRPSPLLFRILHGHPLPADEDRVSASRKRPHASFRQHITC